MITFPFLRMYCIPQGSSCSPPSSSLLSANVQPYLIYQSQAPSRSNTPKPKPAITTKHVSMQPYRSKCRTGPTQSTIPNGSVTARSSGALTSSTRRIRPMRFLWLKSRALVSQVDRWGSGPGNGGAGYGIDRIEPGVLTSPYYRVISIEILVSQKSVCSG